MNIRDIATIANVSVATVSKIMNHKDSEISDETRQKVLKVIKEYQYTPYANLKSVINTGKSQIIAFIAQGECYDSHFIFQIEKNAAQMGYSLMLCNLTKPFSDNLRKYMSIIEVRRVEGILLGISSPELLEEAVSLNYSGLPMAAFTAFSSTACATFMFDYTANTELAVTQLIQLGHKKIGCILNHTDEISSGACLEGYKNALVPLSQYGAEHYIVYSSPSHSILRQRIQTLLQAKVTGVFCQTAPLANIVYEILKEEKYYIPNSISVICGETAPHAHYFNPVLTSCALPVSDIIASATAYLIDCIESRSISRITNHNFPPVMISGESIAASVYTGKQILVVGNCNTDINLRLPRIPASAELITASNLSIIPGGKATAQAVGAGKLGGSVYILGCVGNDAEGNSIIDCLKNAYVHIEGLSVFSSHPTGKSYIFVPDNSNSSVIVYPGANSAYKIEHLRSFRHLIETSDYCLLSTELNEDLIAYIIHKCEQYGTEILLKPSSIDHFPDDFLPRVAYMIPNRYELDCIFPDPLTYQEKADVLFQKGCKNVIVTLGSEGCYLKNKDYSVHIPAANFNAVDSTGAANCFIAALAVSLSKGSSLLYSLCYATYAAGISTTQPGVQISFPDKYQLELYTDDIQELHHTIDGRKDSHYPEE